LRALADAAAGDEFGPGWYARAAEVVADVVGARRAAFWRLQADGMLAVEEDPFGFDDRERRFLKTLAVHPSSADIASRVVFDGEEFSGPVASGDGSDQYLVSLEAAGIRAHAAVAWQLGSVSLGMVAAYDGRDGRFAGDALRALRASGAATALIAELKESRARQTTTAAAEERRAREVALIQEFAGSVIENEDVDAIAHAAVRAAAQIVSSPGATPRRASYLRSDGDELVAIAEYDELGERLAGRYRLDELEALNRVVGSGQPRVIDFRTRDDIEPDVARLIREHNLRSVALIPVHSGGEVTGVLAIAARDADGFDQLQVRLLGAIANILGLAIGNTERTQALRRSAERSQQLEELKSDFLNVAAHELRSPLGILRGYVSMLLEESLPEEHVPRVLKLLESKTDEMARLIDEMLETAAVEDVNVRLSLERVDLLDVIDAALAAMEPLLGDPHRLVVRGRREPLPLTGDRRRLTTALTNLIDNAVKYSPDGGDIEVGWDVRDGRVVVSVTDHGIGIRPEDLGDLFKRFGRIVTPENSHIRGSGLGLYLSNEIVRRHDGDITVQSAPGQGSTFTVSLPLAEERLNAPS
jgi:signal transduction histidine kinase